MSKVSKLEHRIQEYDQATGLPNPQSVKHQPWDEETNVQSPEKYTKQDLYNQLLEAQAAVKHTANGNQKQVDHLQQTLQDQADYIRNLEQRLMAQQAEMNRTEANLQALIEHTSEMILSVDRDFRVLVINAQMRRFIKNCFQTEVRCGLLSCFGLE